MTKPWNMARVRSHQQTTSYRPVTAIAGLTQEDLAEQCLGPQANTDGTPASEFAQIRDAACYGCGHHKCSCSAKAPVSGGDTAWLRTLPPETMVRRLGMNAHGEPWVADTAGFALGRIAWGSEWYSNKPDWVLA